MANAGGDIIEEWNSFFSKLNDFASCLKRQYGIAKRQYTEFAVERLEMCVESVSGLLSHMNGVSTLLLTVDERHAIQGCVECLRELLECLRSIGSDWYNYLQLLESHPSELMYRASVAVDGAHRRGRPRFEIGKDQLVYLSSLSFTWSEIASLFGVSRMTIFRRRQEYNLVEDPQNTISDVELGVIVKELKSQHPDMCVVMIMGSLRAMGF